jgi:AcrR family transcriptional regulator
MSTPATRSTQQAILEACRSVVEEARPQSWTMEDVAERAGVTRMTVYRHFSSRAQLLVATVRHVDEVERVRERFASVGDSPDPRRALSRWVEVWVAYIPHVHRLALALLAARHSDVAAAEAWDDRMASLREGVGLIIAWLDREGILRPDLSIDVATDLMWAIASVQVWDALTRDRGWSSDRYRTHIEAALRSTLTVGQDG